MSPASASERLGDVSVETFNAAAADFFDDDDSAIDNNVASTAVEAALLLPGHRLRIRVGDVAQSRKAWKKRRRNASPILIPCSVLGVDRTDMVRRNVITLLNMIGEEMVDMAPAADGSVPPLGATVGKIGRAYKRRLGDLRKHALDLGHDTVESLLSSLFDSDSDSNSSNSHGVRTFVEPRHGNLILCTSSTSYPTKHQARSLASLAGMVQVRCPEDDDRNNMMIHTGSSYVRIPLSVGPGKLPRYTSELLGSALRVEASSQTRYMMGDEFDAYVYDYDEKGDNGCPLLTLTPEDESRRILRGRGGGARRAALSTSTAEAFVRDWDDAFAETGNNNVGSSSDLRELSDLKIGDGPYNATIVAISSRSGALFVDVGVGRRRGKKYGGGDGGVIKVLGMLRFDDINSDEVDDSDENVDNTDTAKKIDDDDFDNEYANDVDVVPGDEIQVYIKAVSTQSGRFMVTLDPSVGDIKAKDRKRERLADKRKERLLSKQLTEEDHGDIQTLVGNVYDGIVKAKSKTGDWYYVQPLCIDGEIVEDGQSAMPVGIANFPSQEEGGEKDHSLYVVGDHVRVRLEGIDERRGQLSLTIME